MRRLLTKKSPPPRASRANWPRPPTSLVYALVQHTPIGSLSIVAGYRSGGTKYITLLQATNIIEAVKFAKLIGLPLVAHLTIHWAYTDVGDDPDGKLFAQFREGLNKWLHRRGIVFAAAWARERQAGGQTDVVHCHLLFHLPVEYRTGARFLQVEAASLVSSGATAAASWRVELRITDPPIPTANTSSKAVAEDLEAFQTQEGAPPIARHPSRQAVRHHAEHWKGCTQPLVPSAANRARRGLRCQDHDSE